MSASKNKPTPGSLLSRYLITGAMGQLGHALNTSFGEEIAIARAHEGLDITNRREVDNIPSIRPDVLINCAAYTNVAMAEKDPEEAKLCWLTNAVGPYNLARMCAKNDIPLFHISSDLVFGQDRARCEPYAERDAVGPMGPYAQSKLAGEHAILQVAAEFPKFRYVIIRTAGLFEPAWRDVRNFPMAIHNLLHNRRADTVGVVDDVFTNLTYAPHLARAVRSMVEALDMFQSRQGKRTEVPAVPNGVYHITNTGITNWHAVADKIANSQIGSTQRSARLVRTTRQEYYKRIGRNPDIAPSYTCLAARRYGSLVFGERMPSWQDALAEWISMADRFFKGQPVEYPVY